jgi:hypothetical protein
VESIASDLNDHRGSLGRRTVGRGGIARECRCDQEPAGRGGAQASFHLIERDGDRLQGA